MTEIWCNNVLVAFFALSKILKDYDYAFRHRLQSSFMSVHLKNGISTQTLVEEMSQINRRKQMAVLLRDTVKCALASLSPEEREILVLRFYKGKTFQEISVEQDVSLRTAFRRFDKARTNLCLALEGLGLSADDFARDYLSDPAVRAVCSRLDDEVYFTAKSNRRKH